MFFQLAAGCATAEVIVISGTDPQGAQLELTHELSHMASILHTSKLDAETFYTLELARLDFVKKALKTWINNDDCTFALYEISSYLCSDDSEQTILDKEQQLVSKFTPFLDSSLVVEVTNRETFNRMVRTIVRKALELNTKTYEQLSEQDENFISAYKLSDEGIAISRMIIESLMHASFDAGSPIPNGNTEYFWKEQESLAAVMRSLMTK